MAEMTSGTRVVIVLKPKIWSSATGSFDDECAGEPTRIRTVDWRDQGRFGNGTNPKLFYFRNLGAIQNLFTLTIVPVTFLHIATCQSGGSCEEVGTVDPGCGSDAEREPVVRGQASGSVG